MKFLVKIASIVIFAFIVTSCVFNRKLTDSKAAISPLSDKTIISDGTLVYALPLTVFDISLEAERIIEKPGPYARFAEDLLGLKDVIKSESEHWTIKSITVAAHEEPDPSGYYIIETNSLFRTNAIAMKREGMILDLNPALYKSEPSLINTKELHTAQVYDLGADEYFQARKDTLYKLLSVDTTFIKVPYLVEKKQKLSPDQLAEKAAGRLMELRDGEHLILTGETNVFPQNEAAINEINRLEKEYLELFTGKSGKESRIFTYHVIPAKEQTGKPVNLCLFSETAGPGVSSGKEIMPVVIEFVPELKTRSLTIINHGNSKAKSQKYDKLFYRVPEVAAVKVSYGSKVLDTSRRLVFQFGEIVQLPANFIIGK